MDELHLEVQQIWEKHFNNEAPSAPPNGRIPQLVDLVTNEAAACGDPPGIFLRPAHKRGTAHRLVENARAGWVTNWREVAREHALAAAEKPTAPVTDDDTGTTEPEDVSAATTQLSTVPVLEAAGEVGNA